MKNKLMLIQRMLLLLLCFVLAHASYSQQEGEIEGKTVIIIKDKKLELPEANRNFEKVSIDPVKMPSKEQEYQTRDVQIALPSISPKMKILVMPPDPVKPLLHNYVKGGMGNYSTSYLEGFLSSGRSQKALYGVHLRHLASARGPVMRDLSGVGENRMDAFGKIFTNSLILRGNASYSRLRNNFYGFDGSFLNGRDTSVKQVYHLFSLGGGFENLDKTDRMNYDLGFTWFNFRDRFNVKEDEYLTNFKGSYKLDADRSLSLGAELSFSSRLDDTLRQSRTYLMLRPAYHHETESVKLRAGVNVAFSDDTLAGQSSLHFYPSVQVDYKLMDEKMIAFAGLDGGLEKNLLRTFVRENPWLNDKIMLSHSNKVLEFYSGVKGQMGLLNYKAQLAYQTYRNLYFFNNSIRDTARFDVLYDTGNTTVLNLGADLSYDLTKEFMIGWSGRYYKYNVSTLDQPWHRPSFVSSVLMRYNFREKIYFNSDIYYISGIMGRNPVSDRNINLPSIVDLNLKIDYRLSSEFSAFLEFNNILSRRYERFLNYPVKGINVIGGLSYSF